MSSLIPLFEVFLSVWWSVQLTTPLRDTDREVILADVYRFGASYEAAKANRIMANNQRYSDTLKNLVWSHYGQDGYLSWQRDCEWRYSIWSALEDALNPSSSVSYRLERLNFVRQILGKDDFADAWLPEPNPQYRMVSVDNR